MALTTCDECQEKMSDKARACPHCGCPNLSYIEEEKILNVTSQALHMKPGALLSVAFRQKLLLYAILVRLALQLPIIVLSLDTASITAKVLALVLWILSFALVAYCFIALGQALRIATWVLIPLACALLIPFVGLIIVMVLVVKSNNVLKLASVPIGLLGVTEGSIVTLEQSTLSATGSP
jgi:hypothetical protein